MIVAIHQPDYAPWLGYFHKMALCDTFVFLDDVQYSRGSYTDRVRIGRVGDGPGSLPVSEELCRRILSLPMHAHMEQAAAERIRGAVKAIAMTSSPRPEFAYWRLRLSMRKR